jgi:DNA polymerase (family 10)
MRNQEIAKIFNEIADILEIKEDNPFRIRAYRRAAQNIDGRAKDVAEISEEDLRKVPGIGTARRGWVEKKDVLNALGYNALIKKRLKSKRRGGMAMMVINLLFEWPFILKN